MLSFHCVAAYLFTKDISAPLCSGQPHSLESFIRDCLLKGNHVVFVFFYLEKAYDSVWKYGVVRDLHKVGLRGRMPMFIQIFYQSF